MTPANSMLPAFLLVAVAVLGTVGWLVTTVATIVVVVRLDEEARAEVPKPVWAVWVASMVASVVWPIGILMSGAAVATGGFYALRGPRRARPVALCAVATGGAYLMLVGAILVTAGVVMAIMP